MSKAKDKVIFV